MKPPICEVCGKSFDPANGELVAFSDRVSKHQSKIRSNEKQPVGHPKGLGWFCQEHVAQALERAETMTLEGAVKDIKRFTISTSESAPTPTPVAIPEVNRKSNITPAPDPWPAVGQVGDGVACCATCEIEFPLTSGSFVDFHEDDSIKIQRSLQSGDARWERPSRRWFCARHIGPAMMIGATVGLQRAREILIPPKRKPLEYNEQPEDVAIGAVDAAGEPMRGPFLPVPDPSLSTVSVSKTLVPGRIVGDASRIFHKHKSTFHEALGVDYVRNAGATSANSTHAEDLRWVNGSSKCRKQVHSSHGSDLAMFMITVDHEVEERSNEGGSKNEPLQSHLSLLIQQRERSVAEIILSAGPEATVAPDGLVLLDALHVRVAEELTTALTSAIEVLSKALAEPVFDPFDLGTDLAGVDLKGGQIQRGRFDSNKSSIRWKLRPIPLPKLRQRMFDLLEILFRELNLGDVPDLEATHNRSWSPMDGARPPSCPYTDRIAYRSAKGSNAEVSVTSSQAHWNDFDVANVGINLMFRVDEIDVSISASGQGAGDACTSLTLYRPTSAVVVAALTKAFANSLIEPG